jgi:hypothetical protein
VNGNIPGGSSNYFEYYNSSAPFTFFDFYFIKQDPMNSTGFPSISGIGLNYGVLGSNSNFPNTGQIFSDDEDSGNSNKCWPTLWNGSAWTPYSVYSTVGWDGMPGCLELKPGAAGTRANHQWFFAKAI